jgi:4'-phosphopantetheinyl transferase
VKGSDSTGKRMSAFELEHNQVLVFEISTVCTEKNVRDLYRTLSPDERKRAEKFLFDRDRTTFILTRGVLRKVLGTLTGTDPTQVAFVYGKHGKPVLQGEIENQIHFNVSHTREKALIAVTCVGEVGIDIEYIRPLTYGARISERFFSEEEIRSLRALPKELQQKAFFTCWARKESFIKAKGGGLTIPLRSFAVSVDPRKPAQLMKTDWDENEACMWSVLDIPIGKNYTAALSVRGKNVCLCRRVWRC